MFELSGKSSERPAALVQVEAAMRLPVGVFSPLWMMYAGAASAGVAYWWMARWTRPVNIEALMGARTAAPLVQIPAMAEPQAVALVGVEADIDTEALEAQAFAPPPPVEAIELEVLEETSVEFSKPEPALEHAVAEVVEAPALEPEVAAAPERPKATRKSAPKAAGSPAARRKASPREI
jgi:hypothetical protein